MKEALESFFNMMVTIAITSLMLSGCAPTETKEEKEMRLAREKQILIERQVRLEENVKQRIANGEVPPLHGVDPGFPIAYCVKPTPSDNGYIVNTGMRGGEDFYICQNTKPGTAILEYRLWYCRGEDRSCVEGKWENGKPTFSPSPWSSGILISINNRKVELYPARFLTDEEKKAAAAYDAAMEKSQKRFKERQLQIEEQNKLYRKNLEEKYSKECPKAWAKYKAIEEQTGNTQLWQGCDYYK